MQIETTVLRLVSQIDNARRRIEVLAPTTDHAALDLEAERARFAVGRSTNFDVLRRQDELAQTQLRQRARPHRLSEGRGRARRGDRRNPRPISGGPR